MNYPSIRSPELYVHSLRPFLKIIVLKVGRNITLAEQSDLATDFGQKTKDLMSDENYQGVFTT